MYGICGVYNFQKNEPVLSRELKRMAQQMSHRGTGELGYYVYRNVGLSFQQTKTDDSIHQPFTNYDESVWVVCDGHVENYNELRKMPALRKYNFYTKSSAELILHLYEALGHELLNHLKGSFSFVIWNNRTRSLLAVRDPLGTKPFYYAQVDGRLFFASELKALLCVDAIPRFINVESINQFLHYGFVPGPNTIMDRINKLPAGHFLVCDNQKLEISSYWDIQLPVENTKDETYCKSELIKKLKAAVEQEINPKQSAGIFLSGGLDSSLLVALAKTCTDKPLMTFTLNFENSENGKSPRPTETVSQLFETRHFDLTMTPEEFRNSFNRTAWYLDEPIADPSAIASLQLGQFVKQNLNLALSGDGIDELFSGKDEYLSQQQMTHAYYFTEFNHSARDANGSRRLPHVKHCQSVNVTNQKDVLQNYLNSQTVEFEEQKLYSNQMWMKLKTLNKQWLPADVVSSKTQISDYEKIFYLDLKYKFPNILFQKYDRLNGALAIDIKVPYLSLPVVQFSAGVPFYWKVKNSQTKYLIRQIAHDFLPELIINQPRTGWQIPVTGWLRNQLQEWPKETLMNNRVFSRGLFNPERLKEIITNFIEGKNNSTSLIYSLICLESWFRLFVDGDIILAD